MRLPTPLVGCLVLLAGCFTEPRTTQVNNELTAAKNYWSASAPASYDVTVRKSCYCAFETEGPVVVSVRNRVVTSRRYVSTGAEVSGPYALSYPSVDEMYGILQDAVDRHADRLEVLYDTQFWFPVSVAIDYKFLIADDETFFTMSNFIVR